MTPDPPIPGQTPIDDISGLRVKVRTQAELNALEAENIRRAVVKHLIGPPPKRPAPMDTRRALRLHKDMFGRVWLWAGSLRKRETNLGSPPHRVETDLHTLFDDLAAWPAASMPIIEQAARLHHRAVSIHPFPNGNGRWARMLANVHLHAHAHPLIIWPEATIGSASIIRDEYLDAVRAADRGNLAHLVRLHEKFTEPRPSQ